MTLEEISKSLINGFHDAVIIGMQRDFERATLSLLIDILIELPKDVPDDADRYRRGNLEFTGVSLCTVETPDAESAFPHPGGIWVVVNRATDDVWPTQVMNRLPSGSLIYSLFILDWHSNINIATKDITFSWLD